MKTLLAFFLFWQLQWAYCQPAPVSVNLPLTLTSAAHAQLNALVNDILKKDAALNAELKDVLAEERTGEINLAVVQRKLDTDEREIVTLKTKLASLQQFARVVLGIVFAVAAAFAWRLTAGLAFPPPWGLVVRLGVCLAAGGACSALVWRLITHLL